VRQTLIEVFCLDLKLL